jgi:hypothetical protein
MDPSSGGKRFLKISRDHNLAPRTTGLGIFFLDGLRTGQAEGIETEQLELPAAGRAGEDLAPVDVEVGDGDRVPA